MFMEVNIGVIITNIHDDIGHKFISKLTSMYGDDDIDLVVMNYITSGCIFNYNKVEESLTASLRPLLASDILLIPFSCSNYESFLGAERSMQWAQSVRPNIKAVFVGMDKWSAEKSDLAYLDIVSTEKRFVLEIICNLDAAHQITNRIKRELDIKGYIENSPDYADCKQGKSRKLSRLHRLREMFFRKSNSSGTQSLEE